MWATGSGRSRPYENPKPIATDMEYHLTARTCWTNSNRKGPVRREAPSEKKAARAVFRCIACAATLTPPPPPPSQGGESRRRLVFFPPCDSDFVALIDYQVFRRRGHRAVFLRRISLIVYGVI